MFITHGLFEWKFQFRNTRKHKILFPAYVCCFSVTAIVFKTFFVSYLTQSGFGNEITTLDEGLDGKVLHAYFQNTKVFFDRTGL